MKILTAAADLHAFDRLAALDTPAHRLDPRAKLLVTLAFAVAVVSCDRYALAALLPFAVFPVALAAAGRVPAGAVLKRLLPALPFVLLVGAFNPLLDREPLLQLGPLTLSGGWVSFASIALRGVLTLSGALVLIATTGFPAVCLALGKLGAPRPLVLQLLFLHRYLFVLLEEAGSMVRAREQRRFGSRKLGLKHHAQLLGHLLLRTLDRAQRLHRAMLSRGFDGEIRLLRRLRFRRADAFFVGGWLAVFLLLRLVNLPQWLGGLVVGV